ncbi:MAG: hypothetical protein KBS91_00950 [Firmicutes bacterium]|nr:hypothetical protein [Candidatus Caballimonas caccae]
MIDIHTHYIPNVDDGSENIDSSLKMLKEAVSKGISDIICTPHFREPFKYSYSEIKNKFELLKKAVTEEGININLYLGREIFCENGLKVLLNSDNFSMCDSKYVLLEFSSENDDDIPQIVYELKLKGYMPIVAHIERYHSLTLDDIIDVKNAGALIQVNAGSMFGEESKFFKKKVKNLFREGLVDFVSSDIHEDRINYMEQAYKYVSRKFGKEVARSVFIDNAKKIIES